MPAPAVSSLQDLISQFTAAQAPEQAQIDSNIAANEQSGNAQTAGINAAKTNAFGGIEQAASNKGMYFSGFSPDAEAKYTGSTYLPALAKLQATIASTRGSLLGQKATLASQANSNALGEHNNQQRAFDSYQTMLQQETNAAAEAEKTRQFEASQGAANRAASASAAAAKVPSVAQQKASATSALQQDILNSFQGFGSRPTFYTEKTILPTLVSAYAGSGISSKDITNAVYQTRKALGYG